VRHADNARNLKKFAARTEQIAVFIAASDTDRSAGYRSLHCSTLISVKAIHEFVHRI